MVSDTGEITQKRLSSVFISQTPGQEPLSEQHYSPDEAGLARFGKRQQLKVHLASQAPCLSLHRSIPFLFREADWYLTAQLRPPVYHQPDMHSDGHLGKHFAVRIYVCLGKR